MTLVKSRAVKIDGSEETFSGSSLFQIQSGKYLQNVGHYEHLGFIGGKPGTMKSTILRYIAAAGAEKCHPFGFRLNLGDKSVIWFDGEQPKDIVVNSVNHIVELSCANKADYLEMYSLNHLPKPIDRRRELHRIVREEISPRHDYNEPHQAGVIIVDGLANFVNNINNFDEVGDFMDQLTTTAKRLKCMVIVLSHIVDFGGNRKLYGAGGTRLEQLASWGFYMRSEGQYFIMELAKGRYGWVAPKVFRWGKGKNELIESIYCPA